MKPVPYNDWREIDVPALAAFEPQHPVSVVMPYYAQPAELARALAALEGQTWPRELFEVVVVDDGSPEPLTLPASTPLNLRVVRQDDRGFGAARARNAGARAAAHDILLFLDADMLPERNWLAAHARWHHAVADALTQGLRTHVAFDDIDAAAIRNRSGTLGDLFVGRKTEPVWFEPYLRMTRELTSKSDNAFRIVSSCNLGVRRGFFDLVGGFDGSLTQWGGEDTEFGYRAWARGGMVIPERDGFAWHDGLWTAGRREKERALRSNMAMLAQTIAHPQFRRGSSGPAFAVPQTIVTIRAGAAAAEQVRAVVARVLSGPLQDLAVRLALPGDAPERGMLQRHFEADPRVQITPLQPVLDAFPTARFHVEIPASTWVQAHTVSGLCAGLEDAVMGHTTLPDGATASITRIWALHRAQRTAGNAAEFGDSVCIPYPALRPASFRRALATRLLRGPLARLRAEWRLVDGPAAAWLYVRWLGSAVMRRVRWRFAVVRQPGWRPRGTGQDASQAVCARD